MSILLFVNDVDLLDVVYSILCEDVRVVLLILHHVLLLIIIYLLLHNPVGYTPTKSPTPSPSLEPTFVPSYFTTESPTITPKPSEYSLIQGNSFFHSLFFDNMHSWTFENNDIHFDSHFLLAYKPTFDPDDPSLTFFCGDSWDHADITCGMRCPTGNTDDCPG